MLNAAATPACSDDDVEVELGEYRWNLHHRSFHSENLGAGRIVSVLDEDGEIYEIDEMDKHVTPVIAIVEIEGGEYAGRFIDVDITNPDYTYPASRMN